ncbi:sodium/hydrogen exchanger 9B2-like isoform X2 [Rhodnius prolixus]|uniref:sodium/hydrogen exchanger 9B2-like isoform X2 n=1 Tax=Rhodnius prolixus TaxID=13249 RepID=UPI003D18EE6F
MPTNLGFQCEENNIEKNKSLTPINNATTNEQSEHIKEDTKKSITKGQLILHEQCYIPKTSIHTLAGVVITVLLLWVSLYVIIKDAILPKTDLFKILVLILCSYSSGMLFTMIGLPHISGMFLTGSVFRSVGFFNLTSHYKSIIVTLRLLAISVTLTKSGLVLNTDTLIKYKWSILKYLLIPCTMEAMVFAVLAKYIFQFPWFWALTFGYVICATNSGPLLNTLNQLKNQGTNEHDRMKTLFENATYLDNIYSISAFAVCLNALASSSDIPVSISYGILDLMVAFLVGVIMGSLTACFPHKKDEYMVPKRCFMVFLNGVCTYFGLKEIGFPSGGPLSCFVAGATSTFCWKTQGWSASYNPVLKFESKLWNLLMEPLLFGLVGTEIDLTITDISEVFAAIGIFLIIILLRAIFGFFILTGENFELKEKLFVILSWMPKGTVQAALSPQPLDMLRTSSVTEEEDLKRAEIIVRVSVLAVIFFTTLFSLVIKFTNKKLLSKNENANEVSS